MSDEESDEDLRDICTGCGREIADEEDIVTAGAMRRSHGVETRWHLVLCANCDWRAEYSAHLKWVVTRDAASNG